jgi:ectoine hydroxylase-related dioxygenase (phytanoyl-CoA dioxygenase family)
LLLYTIPLDEVINQNNGMPKFIKGSHKAEQTELAQLPEEELELRLGDVLVWEGNIKFICSGTAGAAFMGIAWAAN